MTKERSDHFFNKIKTSKNLPSLPHILLKLIEVCNREDSNIKDISQIISKDASLTAKVMKMINSAYYGLPVRVTDIDHALAFLGMDAIKNISICASVNQAFSHAKNDSLFDLKVFWKHSLMCAALAKLIAQKTLYPSPDTAFLSGLLHDIGKLVIWVNFPQEYAEILKSSKNQPDLILAGEARHGATHCEVGAWLINRWNLQSFIADALLYHHESVDRIHDALPLVKIIYIANILCPEIDKEEAVKYKIAESILGITIPETKEIIIKAGEEVREVALSLNLDIAPVDIPGAAISDNDSEKQQDLTREVKDFSLILGTLQNLLETQDEDSILRVLHQGIDILFDAENVFFFQYDPKRNILIGKSMAAVEQENLINEVIIPLQKGKSLLAKSLLNARPFDSFEYSMKAGPAITDLAIIDEQLIRLTGGDGILCIPMIAHKEYVGVLVFGLEKDRFSNLSEQMNLLTMFARQAAHALYSYDLRERQAELVLSERLTAASDMAKTVVHEVNTPLSITKNYLAVLKNKLAEDKLVQDELRIINEEIDRVAHIVHELSDFSEPEIRPAGPFDINALLSDLIRIFRKSSILRPNINVRHESDKSLPSINTDKNRLKQVFINLIKNAVEAVPGGGNIYIRTRYTSNSFASELKQNRGIEPGYLEILIKDDGPGIPEIFRSRLFEPYITSKGSGHAGLGLSVVYNIIKKLKGTITCESNDRDGTSFKIVLPVC